MVQQPENERMQLLERVIKLSQADQKRHLTYLARCSVETRLYIFEKQRELFHVISQKHNGEMKRSALAYCALILAIGVFFALEKKVTRKNFSEMTLDEIRDLSALRAMNFKHKTKKRSATDEKLMQLWATIRTLKIEHSYSYARIALYLKAKHRFSVAVSTIHKKWQKIETKNKTTGELK